MGESAAIKKNSGRNKKFSDEEEKAILIAAEADRDLTACDLANDKNINSKYFSQDTINSRPGKTIVIFLCL